MEAQGLLIKVGCLVELNLIDSSGIKNRLVVDIVPDESADFANGFLGESTPIAQAILGEKAGIIIPYLIDDIYAIEVINVSPSRKKASDRMQEKRILTNNTVIREVEHTNAVIFASSFSGKWGDYDPDSLPKNEETEDEGVG